MSELKDYRNEIGYKLITILESNDDLPMPNRYRLAKTMNEYFISEGMIDDIKADGYKWVPDVKYWEEHLASVASYMRKAYKIYFGYTYKPGVRCTEGDWKFMQKNEWKSTLKINHKGIGTRVDNQNDKLDDTKWQIDIPHIQEVPLLN